MSRNHWLNFIVIETPLGCSRLTLGRHWVWKATWWKKRWSVTPFKQYQYYVHFLQVLSLWVSEVLVPKDKEDREKVEESSRPWCTWLNPLCWCNCQTPIARLSHANCQQMKDKAPLTETFDQCPLQSGAKSWLTYMQYHNPDSTSRREAKKTKIEE